MIYFITEKLSVSRANLENLIDCYLSTKPTKNLPPKVGDGCDTLYTMSPVWTIFTLDFMVYVASVILGSRIVSVYQQREVRELVKLEGVVEVTVVETVLVPWAGLAEVRQLVQVI